MKLNKILIATSNQGKMREILSMLPKDNHEYISLNDLPSLPINPDAIVEDGETFEDNALIKAMAFSKALNMPVMAEDSGLCVEALNGAPGVYSARYSGVEGEGKDRANIKKLLDSFKDIPDESRSAFFICCMVLVSCEKKLISVEGRVDGIITKQPEGTNGFGYDPIFYYPPSNKTFAEMDLSEKNKVSHRFKALEKLSEALKELDF